MVAILLLSFGSCSDESTEQFGSNLEESSVRKGKGQGIYLDGILTFESVEEAQNYLVALEEAYAAAEDQNVFLIDQMSQRPGKTLLEENWGANLELYDNEEMDSDGFEAYKDQNWFKDEMKMLMLNADYELGVANDIYVWYDQKRTYKFPKTNDVLRSLFQDTPKNSGGLPTSIILEDPEPVHSGFEIFYSKGDKVVTEPDDPEADPRFFQYTLRIETENLECSELQKLIKISLEEQEIIIDAQTGGQTIIDNGAIPADFSVDFGDNTTGFFPNEEYLDIIHDYPEFGSYNMMVTATFFDVEGNPQTQESDFEVLVTGACSKESLIKEFSEGNSSRKMTGFLEYKSDLFGAKWVAKTIGWRWSNSKNKWVKKKGSLKVSGWGTFRNDNCNINETNSKSESCGNCRSKRTAKHAGLFQYNRLIGSDDMRSYHRASFSNGSTFELDLSLDPCG